MIFSERIHVQQILSLVVRIYCNYRISITDPIEIQCTYSDFSIIIIGFLFLEINWTSEFTRTQIFDYNWFVLQYSRFNWRVTRSILEEITVRFANFECTIVYWPIKIERFVDKCKIRFHPTTVRNDRIKNSLPFSEPKTIKCNTNR